MVDFAINDIASVLDYSKRRNWWKKCIEPFKGILCLFPSLQHHRYICCCEFCSSHIYEYLNFIV